VKLIKHDPKDFLPFGALYHIKRALKEGDGGFTVTDIIRGISDGTFTLWLLMGADIAGAGVTCVQQTPRLKFLFVLLGSAEDGYRKEWVTLVPKTLKEHAKQMGCSFIRMECREGFKRLFPKPDISHTSLTWNV
jgi:hypothetical protein